MKNFEKVIGVTMLIAVIVVLGVFVYHSMYGSSRAASEVQKNYPLPLLQDTQNKPEQGIGTPAKQSQQTQEEAVPLTDDNLLEELQKTVDDEGKAELDKLKALEEELE